MRVTFKDGADGANRFNDLLSRIPVGDLANRLGTDEETASEALVAALPALLAKLQDNASSQQGAASLASALQQHNNDLVRGSQVNLSQVDTQDGNNILRHVFGNQRQEVAQQLASDQQGVEWAARVLLHAGAHRELHLQPVTWWRPAEQTGTATAVRSADRCPIKGLTQGSLPAACLVAARRARSRATPASTSAACCGLRQT